jgi:hypothetical protein
MLEFSSKQKIGEKVTMQVDTKYKHFRNGTTKGGATIGWTYDDNTLYVAVANCSMTDNFEKKKGRDLVDSRIALIKENGTDTDFSTTYSLNDIKAFILNRPQKAFKDETYEAFINALTFKDFKYEFLAHVASLRFFS